VGVGGLVGTSLGCGLGWFLCLGWFLGFIGVWERGCASLLCMGVCLVFVVVGVGYVEVFWCFTSLGVGGWFVWVFVVLFCSLWRGWWLCCLDCYVVDDEARGTGREG
jgi:hypothetical protein